MTYAELLEEFKETIPVEVIDYRPLAGKETIIVWIKNGNFIIVKRIKEKTFVIESLETSQIYTTTQQIEKNGEKIVYIHNEKNMCDSNYIFMIVKDYVYFSDNVGVSWTIV